mgnify:CR=1 FL=1
MLAIENLQVRADLSSSDLLLDGFSLTLREMDVVGIMGPSGCGKTTLLRTIVGLIDPAGGSIRYKGQSPQELGWPKFRRQVSLVPQRPVLWDGTVYENIARPLRYSEDREPHDRDTVGEFLAKLGMEDMIDAPASTLSQGERQRVCLLRARFMSPNVFVLDEPTSALDEVSIGRVERMFNRMIKGSFDTAILVATHDRAFAERFCTRVIDLAEYMPAGKAVTHD